MYKVLIVDDEKYVISLIEKLVDWEKLGMEVVGSAGDGIQGINLVERLKPDILIADVKMPGFDGISMVKRVREIDRDIKFIIISGHKRFEYAKSVMKYNVEDYLLKPIDKEELEGILQNIRKELDQKMLRKKAENEMSKRWDVNRSLMNAQFMEHLYSGRLFEEKLDLESVYNRYFIEFREDVYQCIIVQLNGVTSNVGVSFVEDLLLSISSDMSHLFEKACSFVLHYIGHRQAAFLLAYQSNGIDAARKCIYEAFKEGIHRISKYQGLKLAMSVGADVEMKNQITPLKESFLSAERTLDFRFVEGYENIFWAKHISASEERKVSVIEGELLEEFRKDVRSASKSVISRRVEGIYNHFMNEIYLNPRLCTQIAWDMNDELYQYLKLFRDTEGMQAELRKKMKYKIEEATNIKELIFSVSNYIFESIEDMTEDGKSRLSPSIRTAKIFINNNYMHDIRLNDVAGMVNLSPVYFSGLFKREIGENFTDYVNRVRIDSAKVMLKDVRNNVGEIAEMCGFSDTRYFAKIFKRMVGITPSEYRKRQTGK